MAHGKVKEFWEFQEECATRAWLGHFDMNNNGRIDWDEFCLGMQKLNFQGNTLDL